MTITEHRNTTPEWQTRLDHNGYLLPLQEQWAHDTDYLLARLHKALSDAAEHAAKYRAKPDYDSQSIANDIELNLLRTAVEELSRELHPHSRAGDAFLADLKERYPSLSWFRIVGRFHGYASTIVRDADPGRGEAVAGELLPSAEPSEKDQRGYRRWTGTVDGWNVTVMGE